jgi:hypothetical protein
MYVLFSSKLMTLAYFVINWVIFNFWNLLVLLGSIRVSNSCKYITFTLIRTDQIKKISSQTMHKFQIRGHEFWAPHIRAHLPSKYLQDSFFYFSHHIQGIC